MGLDEEQPLLQKTVLQHADEQDPGGVGVGVGAGAGVPILVYRNCPGCKASYLQHPDSKLSYKELGIVALLALVNALPISSLYPFLYFMVEDFNIAKSDEDIGYYAGCIGSVYMLGRFATSVHWGMAADKYGRKPVMITGTCSIIIFHTMFGASRTFWMAVLSRFLLGSICSMGTVKAYSAEILNERHQPVGVSIIGTMWGFGLIIGPAIGGYLSQPAIKYPHLFPPGSLFSRFAYLLPSLCITLIAILALFLTFLLPETLHKHGVGEAGEPEEQVENARGGPIDKVVPELVDSQNLQEYQVECIQIEEDNGLVTDPAKKTSLLTNKALIASVTLTSIWALHDMAYVEIFSLWCVSPSANGGLNLSTTDVGQILAISGFVMLLFNIVAFTPLVHCMGPIHVSRTAAVSSVFLCGAFPLMMNLHGATLWVILNLASVFKHIFTTMVFTACFMLVNNSVTRDQIGAANGVLLSAVSLFKCVGPASGGIIYYTNVEKVYLSFALGQVRQDAYILPGIQLVFFFLGATAFVSVLTTFEPFLPRSLDRPKGAES